MAAAGQCFTNRKPQKIWMLRKLAAARAISRFFDLHRRERRNRLRQSFHNRRARRRHQLNLRPRRINRRPANNFTVAGAGTGKIPCAHFTVPPPTLSGEQTHSSTSSASAPTAAQMMSTIASTAPTSWKCTLLDGRVVNLSLGGAQRFEDRDGCLLRGFRNVGRRDNRANLDQSATMFVRMTVIARIGVFM